MPKRKPDSERFLCPLCPGKTYASTSGLARHTRVSHDPDLPKSTTKMKPKVGTTTKDKGKASNHPDADDIYVYYDEESGKSQVVVSKKTTRSTTNKIQNGTVKKTRCKTSVSGPKSTKVTNKPKITPNVQRINQGSTNTLPTRLSMTGSTSHESKTKTPRSNTREVEQTPRKRNRSTSGTNVATQVREVLADEDAAAVASIELPGQRESPVLENVPDFDADIGSYIPLCPLIGNTFYTGQILRPRSIVGLLFGDFYIHGIKRNNGVFISICEVKSKLLRDKEIGAIINVLIRRLCINVSMMEALELSFLKNVDAFPKRLHDRSIIMVQDFAAFVQWIVWNRWATTSYDLISKVFSCGGVKVIECRLNGLETEITCCPTPCKHPECNRSTSQVENAAADNTVTPASVVPVQEQTEPRSSTTTLKSNRKRRRKKREEQLSHHKPRKHNSSSSERDSFPKRRNLLKEMDDRGYLPSQDSASEREPRAYVTQADISRLSQQMVCNNAAYNLTNYEDCIGRFPDQYNNDSLENFVEDYDNCDSPSHDIVNTFCNSFGSRDNSHPVTDKPHTVTSGCMDSFAVDYCDSVITRNQAELCLPVSDCFFSFTTPQVEPVQLRDIDKPLPEPDNLQRVLLNLEHYMNDQETTSQMNTSVPWENSQGNRIIFGELDSLDCSLREKHNSVRETQNCNSGIVNGYADVRDKNLDHFIASSQQNHGNHDIPAGSQQNGETNFVSDHGNKSEFYDDDMQGNISSLPCTNNIDNDGRTGSHINEINGQNEYTGIDKENLPPSAMDGSVLYDSLFETPRASPVSHPLRLPDIDLSSNVSRSLEVGSVHLERNSSVPLNVGTSVDNAQIGSVQAVCETEKNVLYVNGRTGNDIVNEIHNEGNTTAIGNDTETESQCTLIPSPRNDSDDMDDFDVDSTLHYDVQQAMAVAQEKQTQVQNTSSETSDKLPHNPHTTSPSETETLTTGSDTITEITTGDDTHDSMTNVITVHTSRVPKTIEITTAHSDLEVIPIIVIDDTSSNIDEDIVTDDKTNQTYNLNTPKQTEITVKRPKSLKLKKNDSLLEKSLLDKSIDVPKINQNHKHQDRNDSPKITAEPNFCSRHNKRKITLDYFASHSCVLCNVLREIHEVCGPQLKEVWESGVTQGTVHFEDENLDAESKLRCAKVMAMLVSSQPNNEHCQPTHMARRNHNSGKSKKIPRKNKSRIPKDKTVKDLAQKNPTKHASMDSVKSGEQKYSRDERSNFNENLNPHQTSNIDILTNNQSNTKSYMLRPTTISQKLVRRNFHDIEDDTTDDDDISITTEVMKGDVKNLTDSKNFTENAMDTKKCTQNSTESKNYVKNATDRKNCSQNGDGSNRTKCLDVVLVDIYKNKKTNDNDVESSREVNSHICPGCLLVRTNCVCKTSDTNVVHNVLDDILEVFDTEPTNDALQVQTNDVEYYLKLNNVEKNVVQTVVHKMVVEVDQKIGSEIQNQKDDSDEYYHFIKSVINDIVERANSFAPHVNKSDASLENDISKKYVPLDIMGKSGVSLENDINKKTASVDIMAKDNSTERCNDEDNLDTESSVINGTNKTSSLHDSSPRGCDVVSGDTIGIGDSLETLDTVHAIINDIVEDVQDSACHVVESQTNVEEVHICNDAVRGTINRIVNNCSHDIDPDIEKKHYIYESGGNVENGDIGLSAAVHSTMKQIHEGVESSTSASDVSGTVEHNASVLRDIINDDTGHSVVGDICQGTDSDASIEVVKVIDDMTSVCNVVDDIVHSLSDMKHCNSKDGIVKSELNSCVVNGNYEDTCKETCARLSLEEKKVTCETINTVVESCVDFSLDKKVSSSDDIVTDKPDYSLCLDEISSVCLDKNDHNVSTDTWSDVCVSPTENYPNANDNRNEFHDVICKMLDKLDTDEQDNSVNKENNTIDGGKLNPKNKENSSSNEGQKLNTSEASHENQRDVDYCFNQNLANVGINASDDTSRFDVSQTPAIVLETSETCVDDGDSDCDITDISCLSNCRKSDSLNLIVSGHRTYNLRNIVTKIKDVHGVVMENLQHRDNMRHNLDDFLLKTECENAPDSNDNSSGSALQRLNESIAILAEKLQESGFFDAEKSTNNSDNNGNENIHSANLKGPKQHQDDVSNTGPNGVLKPLSKGNDNREPIICEEHLVSHIKQEKDDDPYKHIGIVSPENGQNTHLKFQNGTKFSGSKVEDNSADPEAVVDLTYEEINEQEINEQECIYISSSSSSRVASNCGDNYFDFMEFDADEANSSAQTSFHTASNSNNTIGKGEECVVQDVGYDNDVEHVAKIETDSSFTQPDTIREFRVRDSGCGTSSVVDANSSKHIGTKDERSCVELGTGVHVECKPLSNTECSSNYVETEVHPKLGQAKEYDLGQVDSLQHSTFESFTEGTDKKVIDKIIDRCVDEMDSEGWLKPSEESSDVDEGSSSHIAELCLPSSAKCDELNNSGSTSTETIDYEYDSHENSDSVTKNSKKVIDKIIDMCVGEMDSEGWLKPSEESSDVDEGSISHIVELHLPSSANCDALNNSSGSTETIDYEYDGDEISEKYKNSDTSDIDDGNLNVSQGPSETTDHRNKDCPFIKEQLNNNDDSTETIDYDHDSHEVSEKHKNSDKETKKGDRSVITDDGNLKTISPVPSKTTGHDDKYCYFIKEQSTNHDDSPETVDYDHDNHEISEKDKNSDGVTKKGDRSVITDDGNLKNVSQVPSKTTDHRNKDRYFTKEQSNNHNDTPETFDYDHDSHEISEKDKNSDNVTKTGHTSDITDDVNLKTISPVPSKTTGHDDKYCYFIKEQSTNHDDSPETIDYGHNNHEVSEKHKNCDNVTKKGHTSDIEGGNLKKISPIRYDYHEICEKYKNSDNETKKGDTSDNIDDGKIKKISPVPSETTGYDDKKSYCNKQLDHSEAYGRNLRLNDENSAHDSCFYTSEQCSECTTDHTRSINKELDHSEAYDRNLNLNDEKSPHDGSFYTSEQCSECTTDHTRSINKELDHTETYSRNLNRNDEHSAHDGSFYTSEQCSSECSGHTRSICEQIDDSVACDGSLFTEEQNLSNNETYTTGTSVLNSTCMGDGLRKQDLSECNISRVFDDSDPSWYSCHSMLNMSNKNGKETKDFDKYNVSISKNDFQPCDKPDIKPSPDDVKPSQDFIDRYNLQSGIKFVKNTIHTVSRKFGKTALANDDERKVRSHAGNLEDIPSKTISIGIQNFKEHNKDTKVTGVTGLNLVDSTNKLADSSSRTIEPARFYKSVKTPLMPSSSTPKCPPLPNIRCDEQVFRSIFSPPSSSLGIKPTGKPSSMSTITDFILSNGKFETAKSAMTKPTILKSQSNYPRAKKGDSQRTMITLKTKLLATSVSTSSAASARSKTSKSTDVNHSQLTRIPVATKVKPTQSSHKVKHHTPKSTVLTSTPSQCRPTEKQKVVEITTSDTKVHERDHYCDDFERENEKLQTLKPKSSKTVDKPRNVEAKTQKTVAECVTIEDHDRMPKITDGTSKYSDTSKVTGDTSKGTGDTSKVTGDTKDSNDTPIGIQVNSNDTCGIIPQGNVGMPTHTDYNHMPKDMDGVISGDKKRRGRPKGSKNSYL